MISRVPFPNCRSGVIGLAIAGNPENDGHLSPWQEAVGHEIIPDTHKNGCANEATTGVTNRCALLPRRTRRAKCGSAWACCGHGRLGVSPDLAEGIVVLASNDAGYMT